MRRSRLSDRALISPSPTKPPKKACLIVLRWTIRQAFFGGFVGDGDIKARSESRERLIRHLLFLVRSVACLGRTKAVAFHGLCQNHCRSALMFHRSLVRVIDFLWIMAAALKPENLFICPVSHQRCRLRILAEEFLADECAVFSFERLVLAVHAFF